LFWLKIKWFWSSKTVMKIKIMEKPLHTKWTKKKCPLEKYWKTMSTITGSISFVYDTIWIQILHWTLFDLSHNTIFEKLKLLKIFSLLSNTSCKEKSCNILSDSGFTCCILVDPIYENSEFYHIFQHEGVNFTISSRLEGCPNTSKVTVLSILSVLVVSTLALVIIITFFHKKKKEPFLKAPSIGGILTFSFTIEIHTPI